MASFHDSSHVRVVHWAARRLGVRWLLIAVPVLAGVASLASAAQAFTPPPCFDPNSPNPDQRCVKPVGIGDEPIAVVEENGVRMRVCPGSENSGSPITYYCTYFRRDGRASLFDIELSAEGWPDDTFPGYDNVSLFHPAPLHHLVVNDTQDPNDAMTGLTLTLDPASGGFATQDQDPHSRISVAPAEQWLTASGGFITYSKSFCLPTQNEDLTAQCKGGPAGLGVPLSVDYALNPQQNYTGGLATLNVEFNYGGHLSPCYLDQFQSPDRSATPDARAADACTPPSHTRITEAKITGRTALFRFTGRHAKSFHCELFRNQRVMFNRGCNSPKPYANPLPNGEYMFVVAGVGTGGVDRKPVSKKFTVR